MKIKMNKKGFTLIELLIVVAIIAILAAIAIPQFSAYRLRAFNGAAQSDVRNTKTLQEAIFAEYRGYGCGQRAVALALNALANPALGQQLIGPLTPATGAGLAGVDSAAIATRFWDGTVVNTVGMGLAASNGVTTMTDANPLVDPIPPATGYTAYMIHTKHRDGNRAFSTNTSPSVCFAERSDNTWIGVAIPLAPVVFNPNFNQPCGGLGAGGSPIANWSAL